VTRSASASASSLFGFGLTGWHCRTAAEWLMLMLMVSGVSGVRRCANI
jgi:hypothetical protein